MGSFVRFGRKALAITTHFAHHSALAEVVIELLGLVARGLPMEGVRAIMIMILIAFSMALSDHYPFYGIADTREERHCLAGNMVRGCHNRRFA